MLVPYHPRKSTSLDILQFSHKFKRRYVNIVHVNIIPHKKLETTYVSINRRIEKPLVR